MVKVKSGWAQFFLVLVFYTFSLSGQEKAYWRPHRDGLVSAKQVLGWQAIGQDTEIVSQKWIESVTGERLVLITERDRKNNFIKLLVRASGECVARLEYKFTAPNCCYIFYLAAIVRRQGYGTLIITQLFNELQLNEYCIVELHAVKNAILFYKKVGFKLAKKLVSPDFYPQLQMMVKLVR